MKLGVDAGPSETCYVIVSDSVLIRNDVKFQLLLILWFYKPFREN